MKWELLTYIVQTCGLIVPFIGIIVLLRKEQTKMSTYLLLTNIGCLILNAGYLLLISAKNVGEAGLAYKVEYLGNVIFYLFFILFLLSYFGKKLNPVMGLIWGIFECSQLAMIWIDLSVEMMHMEMQFMQGKDIEIMYVGLGGLVYEIRYGALSVVLLIFLVYTNIHMFRLKIKEKKEQSNLGRLAGAEFIVLTSLVIAQILDIPYDIVPVAASGSVFFMIVGVIRGEFRIEDVGRSWLFEDMKDAFVIVDSNYGYLDANASAKKFFPELTLRLKNEQLSPQLRSLILSVDGEIEIEGRYYVKRVVPIEEDTRIQGHDVNMEKILPDMVKLLPGVNREKAAKLVFGERVPEQHHIIGYSMLLADITEQHALLEEIKIAKEKAEDANEAKSAFMSNMSHEIRTPMNAIVGMTDILLRSELPDREKEYLTNIRSSGEALLSIINDILDFSKIESGKMEIIEDTYDPMSMLNDLSMIFLNRIAEKPVELIFDIDKEMPTKLYGDGLRIRQVIINIVNNAVKFTDSGCVKLSIKIVEKDGENIRMKFHIRDTGQGIKEEDLGRLFGNFSQVDKKKNKYKEGTGLGLAISRQLVELMGGTISVESTYGQGSEFFFTIPQKIANDIPAARIKREERPIIVAGVMRSSWAQKELEQLVEEYGLTVSDCNFTCARNHKIDYIFTDQVNLISDELLVRMKEKGTTLCVVQNPMTDGTWDKEAVLLNKPLYSMNFCQAINNESVAFETATERVLNFTAPEAKILIVDDNEMNLKVAIGLLEPLKMQIDTACDGRQALEKIQNKQYDIVFMDHMMPVMDGIEAVKALRQMHGGYFATLPVIALTANAVSGAKEEFLEAGMNDFVAKPIRIREICAQLKRWLPKEYMIVSEETNTASSGADSRENAETSAAQKNSKKPALHIEGLDVAEGVLNCGSEELFVSLLGDFYKLIEPKAVKVEKLLADGMLRDYTIEVHALKNTARMIGAMKLSADFYRLEQLGNAGEEETLLAETPAVLELYRSYKPVLKEYAASTEEKKTVDKEDISAVLLKIKEAMDSFDLDGADAALQELEGFELPEALEAKMDMLRAYVADVAMEDVMALTEEMRTLL